MTYKSNAIDDNQRLIVLPIWFIILFFFGVIIISILLFPKTEILKQINNNRIPQPISVYYLEKLLEKYPNDNNLQIALVRQEIGLSLWQPAELRIKLLELNPLLKSETALLKFQLQYYQYFQLPPKMRNDAALNKLSNHLLSLNQLTFTKDQLLQLGQYAIELKMPGLALKYYLKISNITDPVLLKEVAKIAISVSNYQIAFNYYMNAMKYEKNLNLKRNDVTLALTALMAGGLFQQGITVIQNLPDAIINNKKMLVFLTTYTLAANRPDLAQQFIRKALMMQGDE